MLLSHERITAASHAGDERTETVCCLLCNYMWQNYNYSYLYIYIFIYIYIYICIFLYTKIQCVSNLQRSQTNHFIDLSKKHKWMAEFLWAILGMKVWSLTGTMVWINYSIQKAQSERKSLNKYQQNVIWFKIWLCVRNEKIFLCWWKFYLYRKS